MKQRIPAKTFLCGEYVALRGGPAIILTTTPCFELTRTSEAQASGIHPQSPAGRYQQQVGLATDSVHFHDPYHGLGGLGASSAQFVGVYKEAQAPLEDDAMLAAYFGVSWQGQGARPSGYDVLAQARSGCVCIHREAGIIEAGPWPFAELGFVIVHTGKKLATHTHLESLQPAHHPRLDAATHMAFQAFRTIDADSLISAINAFQKALAHYALTTPYSLQALDTLQKHPRVLAGKACGAMGADTLLLLTSTDDESQLATHLSETGWHVVATRQNMYDNQTTIAEIENIYHKDT